MGAGLSSEPNQIKLQSKSYIDTRKRIAVGSSCMQGWREYMEDEHLIMIDVFDDFVFNSTQLRSFSLFGVFDGHGGSFVSTYIKQHLHHVMQEIIAVEHDICIERLLEKSLEILDKNLAREPRAFTCGSTAILVVIFEGKLIAANVGDSRAVLFSSEKYTQLSHDHIPTLPEETDRIQKAGGRVSLGRVEMQLSLSRAVGDFQFKQNTKLGPESQMVIAVPDIFSKTIDFLDDEFIVIASDGIWEALSNEEVGEFVKTKLGELSQRARDQETDNLNLHTVSEELMDHVLDGFHDDVMGKDNMTVIIIALLGDSSIEKWLKMFKNIESKP